MGIGRYLSGCQNKIYIGLYEHRTSNIQHRMMNELQNHHLRMDHISPEIYEERKARYETRINAMLEYVTNDTLCRSRMLLDYFGEKQEHNCGQCDTCIGLRKQAATCQPDREELYEKIHEILSGAPQTPPDCSNSFR